MQLALAGAALAVLLCQLPALGAPAPLTGTLKDNRIAAFRAGDASLPGVTTSPAR